MKTKKKNESPSLRGGPPAGGGSPPASWRAGASGGKGRGNDLRVALIEKALARFLPPVSSPPREIHEAMRYAVLSGGKRFRPLLLLSACEAVGGDARKALLPACAVELIHNYSLVHDDLPAMDNDEMRRGLPTCHKKFGEAVAILAGDALLTQAFELLADFRPAETALQLIRELAEAGGTQGMIGGQVLDVLKAPERGFAGPADLETMNLINRKKTGRLIEGSAVMGAFIGTRSAEKIKRVRRFGQALGLAFQVVDDIMDTDGYLRLMDSGEARQKLKILLTQARKEAQFFSSKGRALTEHTDYLWSTAQNYVPVGLKN